MTDSIDLNATVFAKTELGQQEIQSRNLGLSLLVRRALLLVDGKRTGAELSVFLVGKGDIEAVLAQLLEMGCIEVVARNGKSASAPAAVPQAAVETPAAVAGGDIPGLPPAESRTAKDNEMARNFMINSVNSIIGQNMRITLVKDIFHAETTEQLRTIYHAWAASMSNHGAGSRRLPELKEKLFKVL